MPLKIFRQVLRTEQTKTLLHSEIYGFIFDVHVTEKNIATKNLLQTAKLSFINFVILFSSNNCYIVLNKKEYSKMHGYQNIMDRHVIKTIWTQEEKQWLNALSVSPDMSFFSNVHTFSFCVKP